MAANCYSIVRGKRVRVTRLNDCGAFPAPTTANSYGVSSGFISVAYESDFEDGDEHIQKNANGDLCINDRSCDQFKRIMVTISFCNVDPDLFALITGNALEVDSAGVNVGFRISENVACSNFALELWAGIDGQNPCPTTSECQTLTEGGTGLTSFTLTWQGQTTASVPASATVAQVQTALEGLDLIDPGDVLVTGPVGASNGPWTVCFLPTGRYGGLDVPQMTSTPTGGTGTLVVATSVPGGVVSGGNYGYFLLPFVKNGTLRNFTVENGPTTFEIQGWTDGGGNWARGPYNVVASGAGGVPSSLDDPVLANDHLIARSTTVAPPAAVCGLQTMPAAPTPPV